MRLKTLIEKSGGAEQLKSSWTDLVKGTGYKARSRQHVKGEFGWAYLVSGQRNELSSCVYLVGRRCCAGGGGGDPSSYTEVHGAVL